MLRWVYTFFIISIIAGVVAFSGVAASVAGLAEFVFFFAVALFAVFLVVALAIGRPTA